MANLVLTPTAIPDLHLGALPAQFGGIPLGAPDLIGSPTVLLDASTHAGDYGRVPLYVDSDAVVVELAGMGAGDEVKFHAELQLGVWTDIQGRNLKDLSAATKANDAAGNGKYRFDVSGLLGLVIEHSVVAGPVTAKAWASKGTPGTS